MRYLKTYKLFESDTESKNTDIDASSRPGKRLTIYNDISDMSLDITDDGFVVSINPDIHNIHIHKREGIFTMVDELKQFIRRVYSYLEENGYSVEISSNHGRIYIFDDGRVSTIGHTFTSKYPSLTTIRIDIKESKKLNESSITNILRDTFCDLSDDFPVEVKVGPLHDRVIIRYTDVRRDAELDAVAKGKGKLGWKWQDMEWLKNILPVIASKINYLSEEEGIDREYCDVSISYFKGEYNRDTVRAGCFKSIDGHRKFIFEDEITGPKSVFRLYPIDTIYIAWPGLPDDTKPQINESIPIYYHPKDKILNTEMVDDINDILLELDDEGVYCRMWINDPRDEKFPSGIKNDVVKEILLEINHDGKNEDLVNSVVSRIKKYIEPIGWRLDTTHTDREFTEYRIIPISY